MFRPFLLVGALAALAPACGTGGTGGGGGSAADTGSVVVGVTSDLRPGVDINKIHAVMKASGDLFKDETFVFGDKASPLAFPFELPFLDVAGGTAVEVTLDAFRPGDASTPLLSRSAATEIVAGKKLLFRVGLDSRCVVAPGSSAPTCTAPATCVAGVCEPAHVDAARLQPYSPTWATASNDPCKPAGGATPIVLVGQGQADYLPEMDGDTAQVEAGPQGGHHIWVALRAKGLRQSGSITSISGHFPDLNIDVGPFNVIFTMEPDEGGFCKLYGLRFQLDQVVPIDMLLGHPLDVTVTDPDMDVGVGTRSVVLSKTFLQ